MSSKPLPCRLSLVAIFMFGLDQKILQRAPDDLKVDYIFQLLDNNPANHVLCERVSPKWLMRHHTTSRFPGGLDKDLKEFCDRWVSGEYQGAMIILTSAHRAKLEALQHIVGLELEHFSPGATEANDRATALLEDIGLLRKGIFKYQDLIPVQEEAA